MTKEELEKEATEYAEKSYGNDAFTQVNMPQMIEPVRLYLKQGYLAGAEPREKQIQVLSKRCLQLQQDKGELIDETRELEAKLKHADEIMLGIGFLLGLGVANIIFLLTR